MGQEICNNVVRSSHLHKTFAGANNDSTNNDVDVDFGSSGPGALVLGGDSGPDDGGDNNMLMGMMQMMATAAAAAAGSTATPFGGAGIRLGG
jgi:hypothetical protein